MPDKPNERVEKFHFFRGHPSPSTTSTSKANQSARRDGDGTPAPDNPPPTHNHDFHQGIIKNLIPIIVLFFKFLWKVQTML